MATETRTQKSAYYRRAAIVPTSAQTLQQLFQQALGQQKKIKDRLEAVDASASHFRVVSSSKTVKGMLCGTLVAFERGAHQLVIVDDPEATSLSIGALEPPQKDEKQQQYVPGVLFFAVFENHLAVVHSQSLKTSALEQHIAWLLREKTGLLGSQQGIALADEIKKATKERIRKSHVKALSFGRPFMAHEDDASVAPSAAVALKKSDVSKLTPDSAVVSFIKSILPGDKFAKLNLEDAVFEGNLEVWVEIRYPSRSRSQPADTMKLIDDLAIALRDQEEDTVMLELADGSKVKGSELKISAPITLKSTGGVPQEDAFYDDMAGWLSSLIVNGVVSS
ncbi:hypothetical protein M3I54_43195 [Paraburkholderia sp. CNPSo 3274]|uniref:hypothetical protein n=1 Tax=unclassified Paraburkholderia TaxID=2615204 RepID=UPI0020B6C07B|nr:MULTISPECIES: hypothetical protein [unclassified Paraburkholderia]MCP3713562.1 hypothetical protein [Paraburkholderia sp. CNPSo 3274]MCP3720542.1 hypothetical protein [Paraburkholderia sp. CNPSo 3281]